MYQHNLSSENKRLLSLCHHRALVGSKSYRQLGCQAVHKNLRCICHCSASCPCFVPCNCCHDPFIVRNSQTCPPFIGFTQQSHPSRCSRSTLTTVCFSAFDSSRDHVWSLCVHRGCSPPSSCSGVWDPWSVEYQSCKLAMLL